MCRGEWGRHRPERARPGRAAGGPGGTDRTWGQCFRPKDEPPLGPPGFREPGPWRGGPTPGRLKSVRAFTSLTGQAHVFRYKKRLLRHHLQQSGAVGPVSRGAQPREGGPPAPTEPVPIGALCVDGVLAVTSRKASHVRPRHHGPHGHMN